MTGGKQAVRVLDLMSGEWDHLRAALAKRFADRRVNYYAIDRNARRAGGRLLDEERHAQAELDLETPGALQEALRRRFGSEPFDEIHFHNPVQPRGPSAPAVLRALAALLTPGGRLYHAFETDSPLFNFSLERIREAKAGEVLARNRERIRQAAEKAGLRLDKYGARPSWNDPREAREWRTRGRLVPAIAEAYARELAAHSAVPSVSDHFIILRKPKTSK